ncbi:MAG TPA: N-acetyltransferase, partial [Planctomycetaceae bacterium]|nr:N-acetyltransferase [Planctomycetaceae bacterium]
MIRSAKAQEASILSDLAFRSKGYWGYTAKFLAACREELTVSRNEIAKGNVFVLEEEGRILGFYSLEHPSSESVELGFLFVEPRDIGAGHGRTLLEHACSEATRRGYRKLVIQGDPNAGPFYLAMGAQLVGSRESASIPGRTLPEF